MIINIRVIIETDMQTFQCLNTLDNFAKIKKLILAHEAKIKNSREKHSKSYFKPVNEI